MYVIQCPSLGNVQYVTTRINVKWKYHNMLIMYYYIPSNNILRYNYSTCMHASYQ